MSAQMTPAQTKLRRRKREAQVGLANNAFGATAGAVAATTAFKTTPKTKADLELTRTGRFLLRRKVNPRVAIPAAGGALVGMQVVNGAMDAQSAQYFGREIKSIHDKEKRMKVAKSYEEITVGAALPESDGVGRNLEPVEKGLPSALRSLNLQSTPMGRDNTSSYVRGRVNANLMGRRAATWEGVNRNQLREAMTMSDAMPSKLRRRANARAEAALSAKHRAMWDSNGRKVEFMNSGRDERVRSRQAMRRMDPTPGGARMRKSDSLADVSKKVRRFDPEADRQRRLGAYQGAGTAGALGLAGAAGMKLKNLNKTKLTQLLEAGKLVKVPAALLAGSAGAGAVALGAHRRATSARNERWT